MQLDVTRGWLSEDARIVVIDESFGIARVAPRHCCVMRSQGVWDRGRMRDHFDREPEFVVTSNGCAKCQQRRGEEPVMHLRAEALSL